MSYEGLVKIWAPPEICSCRKETRAGRAEVSAGPPSRSARFVAPSRAQGGGKRERDGRVGGFLGRLVSEACLFGTPQSGFCSLVD
jgi:hypothetical protein